MAYEFKKLNEVDVQKAPTEATNVYVEENGETKRVPASAFGGGGGNEKYFNLSSPAADYSSVSYVDCTYEEIVDFILAGGFPTFVLTDYLGYKYFMPMSFYRIRDDGEVRFGVIPAKIEETESGLLYLNISFRASGIRFNTYTLAFVQA